MALKPLGDGFIKLIKIIISPLVFVVVVLGIAKVGNIKTVGRIGGKALIYFEVVSTIALMIGMVLANFMKPGQGMNIDPSTLSVDDVNKVTHNTEMPHGTEFIMNIIPESVVSAFASNAMLQVILVSCLFGFALVRVGGKSSEFMINLLDHISKVIFEIMGFIMKLTAIATFWCYGFYGKSVWNANFTFIWKVISSHDDCLSHLSWSA